MEETWLKDYIWTSYSRSYLLPPLLYQADHFTNLIVILNNFVGIVSLYIKYILAIYFSPAMSRLGFFNIILSPSLSTLVAIKITSISDFIIYRNYHDGISRLPYILHISLRFLEFLDDRTSYNPIFLILVNILRQISRILVVKDLNIIRACLFYWPVVWFISCSTANPSIYISLCSIRTYLPWWYFCSSS